MTTELHTTLGGRIVAHSDIDGRPVLFLDCDGVLAVNGGPIDRDALDRVVSILRHTNAVVVLCSDRLRDPNFYDEIVEAGMPHYYLRGQCDPGDEDEFAAYIPSFYGHLTGLWAGMRSTTTKVKRIVMWLDYAQSKGLCPSAWCVLDDARSFASDWRTCSVHVQPTGPLVSDADLDRVWSILLCRPTRAVQRSMQATRSP